MITIMNSILYYLYVRLLPFDYCTSLTPYVITTIKSGHQKTRVQQTVLSLTVNDKLGEEAFYGLCASRAHVAPSRSPNFLSRQQSSKTLFHSEIISLENTVLIPKWDRIILIRPDSSWEHISLRSALCRAWVKGRTQNGLLQPQ